MKQCMEHVKSNIRPIEGEKIVGIASLRLDTLQDPIIWWEGSKEREGLGFRLAKVELE